jgi:cobalt-zinc-cadmium resistance protein CzcA
MAFTICFALLGSIVAALVFSPVLSFFLLKIEPEKPLRIVNFMKRHYQPMIEFALRHKRPFIVSMASVFVLTLALIPQLGTQFMPVLEEGVIQMNITMAPSISLDKSMETVLMMERNIKKYPAVEQTISKIGRPEAGSHPHPVNTAHIQIMLKPNDEWGEYKTKDDIVQALNRDLSQYPGVALNFSQPIQNMFDELLSGVKTQLAIKLYGEDLGILRNKADEIKETIEGIPGLVDLSSEQSYGQPQVQIIADRDACAHYGVDVSDILEVVELAVGGEVVDQMYLNNRRFGINIRFKEEYRDDPEAIANLMVHSKKGVSVPLSQVAKVQKVLGPIQVNREKNQRRWTVSANVRGRDMGGVVADIQAAVKEKVKLPPGYYLEYGGQFENQQRAMKRLGIIVPTAFFIIFLFLYLSLGSWRSSFLIFTNVPLALIGGVLGLFIFGEYLSVPASVGFIALFGIAVQNGIIMVTYINQLREDGLPMHTAIVEGCLRRLRPVLMTALTTIAGLVPLLFATGMGSEVQRPLAIVVVFGLFSATFLTLFMIPILYGWFAPPVADEQSASQLLTSDKGE